MSTSLALACRLGAGSPVQSIPRRVRAILRKYGATLLMPGPAGILQYGFQPGNYRESTGQTLASVDQQVGLVVDAAQSPGPEVWTYGSPFVCGNVAAYGAIAGAYGIAPVELGKSYLVQMSVSNLSANGLSVQIGTITPFVFLAGEVSQKSAIVTGITAKTLVIKEGATAGGSAGATVTISVRELPGIHASQATSGYQPYLRQSGGVNSWQFDGSDDRYALSSILSGSNDFCDLHAVTLQPKASASTFADCRNNAGTGTHVGRLRLSNTGILVVSHMNDAGTTVGANGPNIGNIPVVVGSVRQGTAHTVLVDDAAVLSTTLSGAYTCTHSTLGARGSGTSENMQGYLQGSVLLPAIPTEAERAILTKFLAKLQGRNL